MFVTKIDSSSLAKVFAHWLKIVIEVHWNCRSNSAWNFVLCTKDSGASEVVQLQIHLHVSRRLIGPCPIAKTGVRTFSASSPAYPHVPSKVPLSSRKTPKSCLRSVNISSQSLPESQV